MGLTKKLTYLEVKNTIEITGCKLISTEYINSKTKLEIECKCGNKFQASYEKFTRKINPKQQCNECGKKMTGDKNRLKYSEVKRYIESMGCELISQIYKEGQIPLEIRCKTCGEIYSVSFVVFKFKGKHECDSCVNKKLSDNYTLSYEFVKNKIENSIFSNGCRLISKEYISNNTLLEIQCKCGNTFTTTLANFESNGKNQCNECGENIRQLKTTEATRFSYEYVKEFIETNSECKLISDTYINVETKLELQCGCGEHFRVSFKNFKKRYQRRCQSCTKSRFELMVKDYLKSRNVKFKQEYRFDDCKDKNTLPFDFVILDDDSNILHLIECDGKQHFSPVQFGGISIERAELNFILTKQHDATKTDYCIDNNINLIRIPYLDIDIIEEVLDEQLNILPIQEAV